MSMEFPQRRRVAFACLRVGVSLLILWIVVGRVDLGAALAQLPRADGRLVVAALVSYLASQMLGAARWTMLARAVGFVLPFRDALPMYGAGLYFGLALPTTVGADATRAVQLGRRRPGMRPAAASVAFDRLMSLGTLLAICAIALVIGPGSRLLSNALATLTVAGALLVCAWWAAPRAVTVLPIDNALRRLVREDLHPYFADRSLLLAVGGVSLLVVACQIVCQKLLAAALGVEVSFGLVALYHPLVVLAGALPFAVAGFGTREATYVALLGTAGVAPSVALSLSLLWFVVGVLNGLIGGIVYGVSAGLRHRTHPPDRPEVLDSPTPARRAVGSDRMSRVA